MSSAISDDLFDARLDALLSLGKYTLFESYSPSTDRQQDAFIGNLKWQLSHSPVSVKSALFFPEMPQ